MCRTAPLPPQNAHHEIGHIFRNPYLKEVKMKNFGRNVQQIMIWLIFDCELVVGIDN